jgi:hypothetical protein
MDKNEKAIQCGCLADREYSSDPLAYTIAVESYLKGYDDASKEFAEQIEKMKRCSNCLHYRKIIGIRTDLSVSSTIVHHDNKTFKWIYPED